MNPAQAQSTHTNQLGVRLSQSSMNTYGEPLSQAIGDKWIHSEPPAPTDAVRFSLELERISARLLDLNTLLTDRLAFYTKPAGCLGAETCVGSVYHSSYFNNLGNIMESMRLNLNLVENLIKNLEI